MDVHRITARTSDLFDEQRDSTIVLAAYRDNELLNTNKDAVMVKLVHILIKH